MPARGRTPLRDPPARWDRRLRTAPSARHRAAGHPRRTARGGARCALIGDQLRGVCGLKKRELDRPVRRDARTPRLDLYASCCHIYQSPERRLGVHGGVCRSVEFAVVTTTGRVRGCRGCVGPGSLDFGVGGRQYSGRGTLAGRRSVRVSARCGVLGARSVLRSGCSAVGEEAAVSGPSGKDGQRCRDRAFDRRRDGRPSTRSSGYGDVKRDKQRGRLGVIIVTALAEGDAQLELWPGCGDSMPARVGEPIPVGGSAIARMLHAVESEEPLDRRFRRSRGPSSQSG